MPMDNRDMEPSKKTKNEGVILYHPVRERTAVQKFKDIDLSFQLSFEHHLCLLKRTLVRKAMNRTEVPRGCLIRGYEYVYLLQEDGSGLMGARINLNSLGWIFRTNHLTGLIKEAYCFDLPDDEAEPVAKTSWKKASLHDWG